MTAFLNWIYSQASKVYDWFGNSYYTAKNAAVNAWNWAVTKAGEAFQSAVDWAWTEINKARVYAAGLVQQVYQSVVRIRDGLESDLLAFIDWVQWKFSTLSDYASGLINNISDGIYDYIISVRGELLSVLNGVREWLWSQVNDAFGWLVNLRERLVNLVSVFTQERLNDLLSFLSNGLHTLTIFFQNPVVFILDVVQEHVLEFLAYVIAWSLGTTIYELPNNKPWRK